jgi:hypothetical protein
VSRLGVARAVAYGTVAVGTLDILDAFTFFGLRDGLRPARILHGIAAGLVGRQATAQGGWGTAVLGLCLHYLIAFGIVLTYMMVSRRARALARHPFVFGPLYGIVAYFVMSLIVVPMSRVGGTFAPPLPVLVNGLLIHMFGVGLPSALAAAAAPEPGEPRRPAR